jgi:hypothetical protein
MQDLQPMIVAEPLKLPDVAMRVPPCPSQLLFQQSFEIPTANDLCCITYISTYVSLTFQRIFLRYGTNRSLSQKKLRESSLAQHKLCQCQLFTESANLNPRNPILLVIPTDNATPRSSSASLYRVRNRSYNLRRSERRRLGCHNAQYHWRSGSRVSRTQALPGGHASRH